MLKYLLLLILIGGGSSNVLADSTSETTIYNTYNTTESIVASNTTAALSAAGDQNHFDWITKKLQISAGFGFYGGEQAISIGAGKRFGEHLFTGSIQQGSNARSLGIGVTGRF